MANNKFGIINSLYYPLDSSLIETKENSNIQLKSQLNEIHDDLTHLDKNMRHILVIVNDDGE